MEITVNLEEQRVMSPGMPEIHLTVMIPAIDSDFSENEHGQDDLTRAVFQSLQSPLPVVWAETTDGERICCFTPDSYNGVLERLLHALIAVKGLEQRLNALGQLDALINQWDVFQ